MRIYYVQYRVTGQTDLFLAGPYQRYDALEQMDDIAGYMGVYDVRLIAREE
jgi:hypothetical protein